MENDLLHCFMTNRQRQILALLCMRGPMSGPEIEAVLDRDRSMWCRLVAPPASVALHALERMRFVRRLPPEPHPDPALRARGVQRYAYVVTAIGSPPEVPRGE